MGCGCCISVAPLCAQNIVQIGRGPTVDHRMLEATAGDVGCRDVAAAGDAKERGRHCENHMEGPDRFAVWLVVSNIFFSLHNIY